MPTNQQRREAARRHLERQLQQRDESNSKRRQRNLILTILASVIVVLVVVVFTVAVLNDRKKGTATAATASTAASVTGSPTRSAPVSSAAAPALPQTSGPCGYSQTAHATKDVGFPPDPSSTPTTTRVITFSTAKGPIGLTLNGANAPCTTQSIAYLVGKKLYDGTSCFRLVTAGIFVLQCGDPANSGSGGPGYEVKDENLSTADYSAAGTVAMANSGPGTDGSQFFIIYKDSSAGLAKSYTVIGKITTGMDIIAQIAAGGETDSTPGNAGDGKPKIPLSFITATVAPAVLGSGTMVTPAASPTH